MAIERPQSWPFGRILTAISTKLNLDVYGGDGYCYIGRSSGNATPYTSEPYLILTPSGVIVDESFKGAGIWYMGIKRVIQITIAIRTSLDTAGEASVDWVSEEEDYLGMAFVEEQVINSLHLQNVRDVDDTMNLLNTPIQLIPENPEATFTLENPAQDMFYSSLFFEIRYGFYTTRSI